MAAPTRALPELTEGQLQKRILDWARLRGWQAVHIRPLWRRDGKMVTAYEGDKGLPDLIMARRGRVILAEIKNATKPATVEQKRWLEQAGGNGYLWRPKDWDEIVRVLT
jgi:hypothetical protein